MKIHKKQLIVFAEDWGQLPSSTQHLILGLLKLEWDVIWINSVGMREPQFTKFYLNRLFKKIKFFFKKNTNINSLKLPPNLSVIHPMTIPLYNNKLIDKINCFILNKQLSHLLKQKQFSQPYIWISLPTAYPYLKLFISSPIIYYCCDDFSTFDGIDQNKISQLEKNLINDANFIIISNPILAKKMPKNKSHFLDHGVDTAMFQTPYPRPSDLPTGKPIAGFYGCLSTWIDIKLIYHCATTLNDINFVLIGPCDIDISHLLTLPNIFYLGPKPYSSIPAYSQHWDVSLLPFLSQERTIASNPLTLKEYLSSGKPVVSINLPILEFFKNEVYTAHTPQEFIINIKLALLDKNMKKRQELIKNYTWDKQAEKIEKYFLHL